MSDAFLRHQIAGVRRRIRFVAIIDTPNQPAETVPPRAEDHDVKISSREYGNGFAQLGTNLWKHLSPAIERAH